MTPTVRSLIVDDDPVVRITLKHMLETAGVRVDQADSIDSATLALLHHEYSFLVVDYVLTEGTGLDLLDVAPEHLPVILLTGFKDRERLNDERVERVAAYLTKPVSSRELSDTLHFVGAFT